jgi:hypothetical protein
MNSFNGIPASFFLLTTSSMIFPDRTIHDVGIDYIRPTLFCINTIILVLILFFLYLIIRNKKGKESRKILSIAIILLLVFLIVLSFAMVTYKPWYVRFQEREKAKEPFLYYIPKENLSEITSMDHINFLLEMEAIEYQNDFFIVYSEYIQYSTPRKISIKVISSDNASQWNLPIEIAYHIKYDGGIDPSSIGNLQLESIDEEMVCRYTLFNHEVHGIHIYWECKSQNGINWSEPIEIDEYDVEIFEDEITFPERFNEFGFTDVNNFELYKTKKSEYIMIVDFSEYGSDLVGERGNFFAYSSDGSTWTNPIKLFENNNIESSDIIEITENRFMLSYYNGRSMNVQFFSLSLLQMVREP